MTDEQKGRALEEFAAYWHPSASGDYRAVITVDAKDGTVTIESRDVRVASLAYL